MAPAAPTDYHPVVLDRPGLQALIDLLVTDGRRVIGPTVRDGAVVYEEITQIGELPAGWADEQEAGPLPAASGGTTTLLFGYAVGPALLEALPLPAASRRSGSAR